MHIVETRMFCTVCLKSSCLLICFHSWSLDLSQSHIQTIQIPKEEKTGPKPWKNKDKKAQSFTPCHLSSFSSDPFHGSKLFFCFRGFCHFVSPSMSVAHFFLFFGFLFLGFLGEFFTLTSIHWHSFHSSTFYIGVFIELLILATEPSEKMYSKNSSITRLFRYSIGLRFYWYAEVLVPHL